MQQIQKYFRWSCLEALEERETANMIGMQVEIRTVTSGYRSELLPLQTICSVAMVKLYTLQHVLQTTHTI
jgi:hypothetical protein